MEVEFGIETCTLKKTLVKLHFTFLSGKKLPKLFNLCCDWYHIHYTCILELSKYIWTKVFFVVVKKFCIP
jgi:hypothetical protein